MLAPRLADSHTGFNFVDHPNFTIQSSVYSETGLIANRVKLSSEVVMDVESLLKKRSRGTIGVSITTTVQECVALLVEENLGALLVYDAHDRPVGIFSERDVIQGLLKWGVLVLNRQASELMTSKLVTCLPEDNLKDLMPIMIDRGFRHMPVIEKGEVFGMISMRDLVRERISEMELEANILRDMAATHTEG